MQIFRTFFSTTPKNLWNPKGFVTSMVLWWYNCWQEITYIYISGIYMGKIFNSLDETGQLRFFWVRRLTGAGFCLDWLLLTGQNPTLHWVKGKCEFLCRESSWLYFWRGATTQKYKVKFRIFGQLHELSEYSFHKLSHPWSPPSVLCILEQDI